MFNPNHLEIYLASEKESLGIWGWSFVKFIPRAEYSLNCRSPEKIHPTKTPEMATTLKNLTYEMSGNSWSQYHFYIPTS